MRLQRSFSTDTKLHTLWGTTSVNTETNTRHWLRKTTLTDTELCELQGTKSIRTTRPRLCRYAYSPTDLTTIMPICMRSANRMIVPICLLSLIFASTVLPPTNQTIAAHACSIPPINCAIMPAINRQGSVLICLRTPPVAGTVLPPEQTFGCSCLQLISI